MGFSFAARPVMGFAALNPSCKSAVIKVERSPNEVIQRPQL
jgi:hypothetical protein